jgi:stress response protein YsnF
MAQENIGKRFEGYQIYDRHYEKVGKVDDLFVDENDVPEYIGVKTSLFGGPSTLIPMDIVRVNDLRQLVEVASDKETIENAPNFDDDAEITAEFEERVYAHFGATREPPPTDRGGYGAYHDENADVDVAYGERSQAPEYGSTAPATPVEYEYPSDSATEGRGYAEARPKTEPREGARVYDWDSGTEPRRTGGGHSGAGTTDSATAGTVGSGMSMGDTESGEFREHDRNQEGLSQPGSDLEDEDELRVQRSEEELVAGTREREAGSVNVRKRVRNYRERVEVPTPVVKR